MLPKNNCIRSLPVFFCDSSYLHPGIYPNKTLYWCWCAFTFADNATPRSITRMHAWSQRHIGGHRPQWRDVSVALVRRCNTVDGEDAGSPRARSAMRRFCASTTPRLKQPPIKYPQNKMPSWCGPNLAMKRRKERKRCPKGSTKWIHRVHNQIAQCHPFHLCAKNSLSDRNAGACNPIRTAGWTDGGPLSGIDSAIPLRWLAANPSASSIDSADSPSDRRSTSWLRLGGADLPCGQGSVDVGKSFDADGFVDGLWT